MKQNNQNRIKTTYENPDDVLEFGIYKGKTIQYVINHEPNYIIWCLENVKIQNRKFVLRANLKKLLNEKLGKRNVK